MRVMLESTRLVKKSSHLFRLFPSAVTVQYVFLFHCSPTDQVKVNKMSNMPVRNTSPIYSKNSKVACSREITIILAIVLEKHNDVDDLNLWNDCFIIFSRFFRPLARIFIEKGLTQGLYEKYIDLRTYPWLFPPLPFYFPHLKRSSTCLKRGSAHQTTNLI